MAEKHLKRVCQCHKCGNESEMTVTCSLEEIEAQQASADTSAGVLQATPEPTTVKGRSVCSHCGNEADMWIEL